MHSIIDYFILFLTDVSGFSSTHQSINPSDVFRHRSIWFFRICMPCHWHSLSHHSWYVPLPNLLIQTLTTQCYHCKWIAFQPIYSSLIYPTQSSFALRLSCFSLLYPSHSSFHCQTQQALCAFPITVASNAWVSPYITPLVHLDNHSYLTFLSHILISHRHLTSSTHIPISHFLLSIMILTHTVDLIHNPWRFFLITYSIFFLLFTGKFCKSRVPQKMLDDLAPIKDDEEAVKSYGLAFGVEMCRRLLELGAPGI